MFPQINGASADQYWDIEMGGFEWSIMLNNGGYNQQCCVNHQQRVGHNCTKKKKKTKMMYIYIFIYPRFIYTMIIFIAIYISPVNPPLMCAREWRVPQTCFCCGKDDDQPIGSRLRDSTPSWWVEGWLLLIWESIWKSGIVVIGNSECLFTSIFWDGIAAVMA